MSVGGVGRGGAKGRSGGVKGTGGKAPAGGAKGASFGTVDKTASLVGASGLVGSSNVQGAQPMDPIATQALAIAKGLKNGQFKDKREATSALVDYVLKEKMRIKSPALAGRITEALMNDPHLTATLDRVLSKGE